MVFLLLLACGDITNAVFVEDAEYVAVLPSEDRTTLDVPGARELGAKAEAPDRPELLVLTVDIAVGINGAIFEFLHTVDAVRALAPSSRTTNSRSWGPIPTCNGALGATITRTGTGEFDWRFVGTRAGTDSTFLSGTHYTGRSVATGDGSFVYDHGAYGVFCDEDTAGRLVVDYDNREGVDLLVDLDQLRGDNDEVWDAAYAYRFAADEGDFQYQATYDLPDDDTTNLATVSVRTRWIPDVGGRSDASVVGGGLQGRTMLWSQCWADGLNLVYQYDNLGVSTPVGTVAECPFADFAEVDRL